MKRVVEFTLWRILPPALAALVFVVLWAAVIHLFQIKSYLAPSPLEVYDVLIANHRSLVAACCLTGTAALGGLLLSVIVGTMVAAMFSQSVTLRYSLYPYAIFLQTVPIVAIAPLLVMWFGYGLGGVIAVAFILSLFPVIANVTEGMTAIPRSLEELFQLYDASRWQRFVKLQFPHAVPYLVTGVKTSSGLSVIGAIVGEFFVGYGSGFGLGYLIRSAAEQYQADRLFAAVFLSTLLGVIIFSAVGLLAQFTLGKWRHS